MFSFRRSQILKTDYVPHRRGNCELLVWHQVSGRAFSEFCCRIESSGGRGLIRHASSPHARVFGFQHQGREYFYKTFLPRNRLEPIKQFFRGTRAQREFRGYLLLREKGFHSPQVVVLGRERSRNFMITEAIEKGRGLHQYFHEICEPAPAKDRHVEKRAALYHLGTVIGKLHARGICHGDLRWGNVLVDRSHGGQPRVVFLDNERTSSHPRIPDRKRLKNLVQLNIGSDPLITRTDRLRFFQAYLEENPELLSEKKKWMRWILKKTISRLAKRSQDGVPTNGSWSQSAC